MITVINTATGEITNADKEFEDYYQVSKRKWVAGSFYTSIRKLTKPFWKELASWQQTQGSGCTGKVAPLN